MVKIGDYSVALVEAETKTKFQEHKAADGEIYVEVEPDIEYFIRIASTSSTPVLCYLSVDGESLGYHDRIDSDDGYAYQGLWSFVDGRSITKALKFCKAKVSRSGPGVEAPEFWTGEVEVQFFEAIDDGCCSQRQNFECTWSGGDVGYLQGVSDPTKKKGVNTNKGSLEIEDDASVECDSFSKGALLETIRLKYCSAVGLIHAEILPKPPLWDYYRLKHPRKKDENETPPISPKQKDGHEFFDLSNLGKRDESPVSVAIAPKRRKITVEKEVDEYVILDD